MRRFKHDMQLRSQAYLAHEISKALSNAREHMLRTGEWQELSEVEQQEFLAHLKKYSDKCAKVCGYKESWYS